MATLPNPVNTDLSRGLTVVQVAENHGWTELMAWSLALEGKDDLERFKELNWGLRTWDLWDWKMRTRPQLPIFQSSREIWTLPIF